MADEAKANLVINFVLGPEGTNISQAAKLWERSMPIYGLHIEFETVWCKTVDEAIAGARAVTTENPQTLGIFWHCAVYFREAQLVFDNPDLFPFRFQQRMRLDEMQIACRGNPVKQSWSTPRVAVHPSPESLLKPWQGHIKIVPALSNADAAEQCSKQLAEFCVTTKSARQAYGLNCFHSFGSPEMVFFGGVTHAGTRLSI